MCELLSRKGSAVRKRMTLEKTLIWMVVAAMVVIAGFHNGLFVAGKVGLDEKVCIGTNGRMSVPSNRSHHYRNLKDRYANCTYVEGNLELTWIKDQEMDLSFLQHIREVTGYVLIFHVDVRRVVLPSLQVIRGRSRFRLNIHDDNEFALMVTLSRMDNLELPALRDVLAGNVGVYNNYNLCHVKTINWDDIISGINAKYVYVYNFTPQERECPPCDSSCEAGCWGEGPHNCQKFSKINCSPQCHEGRCYGKAPRQCCHLSCAGGCTGPKKSDCLACKKFYDDGECKDECPSLVIYNPNTYQSEGYPKGKYAYGATCVKECPEHLLRDAGACVRSCPPDKEQSPQGECICSDPNSKKCQGPSSAIIHSRNINGSRNCELAIVDENDQIMQCLGRDELCPTGYYYESVGPKVTGALAGKSICKKCHSKCRRCSAYGFHTQVCQECAFFRKGEQCEKECPQDYYIDQERKECLLCASECRGCTGPTAAECLTCRHYRIYSELDAENQHNNGTFSCGTSCPPEFPQIAEDALGPYCVRLDLEPVMRINDTDTTVTFPLKD